MKVFDGFNKSHSASYAVTSFQTAYLKHYYPEHFYASLMSQESTDGDGQDAIAGYVAECKKRGIAIVPPNINDSSDRFTVGADGINYKISTISHVGNSALQHIIDLRPIASFDDFMGRRKKSLIKQNALVNLIKAGTFDFDNPDRAELLWKAEMENRTKKQIKEGYEPERIQMTDKLRAEWEKEVLGMYLSVHPMERYGFKPLHSYADGAFCVSGGEIMRHHFFKDKNQNEMAFFWIDTLEGVVKVVLFGGTLKKNPSIKEDVVEGNIVLIKGKRQGNEVLMNELEVL